MKIPTVGTIGSILLLGGVGYAAYKFYIGDWKLPTLPTLPPLPTPDPETIKETGIVGGIGDIIYNITYPTELRERVVERVTEPSPAGRESAVAEATRLIERTTPYNVITPEPSPEGTYARAVAMTVSEDIHKEGLLMSLLKSPVTIGAGLGAMTQQARYLETLPPAAKTLAEKEESQKRLEFKATPEGIAATILSNISPVTGAITAVSTITDIMRVTTPTPTPPPAPAPLVIPKEEFVAKALAISKLPIRERMEERIGLVRGAFGR